ncbi:hypothetical protein KC19_9G138900 [Ceratodon purpureus]|uniref:HD/PDEase domain-containing protein n=1 Tax=Ceratodon purpureus TaxID=3225 RepID=A0A8T0GTV0_CERPU|nr:hypothetical protein KC19_9G138900 [Ceratodon purpureus]
MDGRESSAEKKRYRRSCPAQLPALPPFTGTLEFTPLFARPRKCEPLILVPTDSSDSSPPTVARESALRLAAAGTEAHESARLWSSGCTLSGVYYNGEGGVGEGNAGEERSDAQSGWGSVGFEGRVERGSIRGSRRTRAEMEGEKAAVIVAAEELVQKVMGAWDSSHDPFHALRVRDLALSLASEEGLRLSSFPVVELAALLHDIDDHKYAARGEKVGNVVESFLKEHNVESNTAEAVLKIVTTMGFKEELGASGNVPISPEFAVVQDADRLDAIGAIGIARAFTFGGSRNRKMHDPAEAPRTSLTKSEYAKGVAQPTTINHFAEKLLKLKDLMKSQAGKKRAQQRHEFMLSFLQQFKEEWEGKC